MLSVVPPTGGRPRSNSCIIITETSKHGLGVNTLQPQKSNMSPDLLGAGNSALMHRRGTVVPEMLNQSPSRVYPGVPARFTDILTSDQKKAFREVFDLFDSNGGGTIDAQELDDALRTVDIHLSKEEITDVLASMDKDGNGEIDFEEFLQLMTNTERFLESMMFKTNEERRQRELLLFDALTQFMKKAALHSINEIVGYYHNKYKKVQTPHVIRHYAAGARLIGLSEQQIRRHLDQLRANAVDNNSPYAQPLLRSFINLSKPIASKKTPPGTIPVPPIPEVNNKAETLSTIKELKRLTGGKSGCGKIRLKFQVGFRKNESSGTDVKPTEEGKPGRREQRTGGEGQQTRTNWISQRFKPTHFLPVLSPDHIKQHKAERRIMDNFQNKSQILTFDDMRSIRKEVRNLSNVFYKRIQSVRCDSAERHWDSLMVDLIPPDLKPNFRRAYEAYTSYRTTPVSSLCSRSLA